MKIMCADNSFITPLSKGRKTYKMGKDVQLNRTRCLKTINIFRVAVIYREATEIITCKLEFTVVMTK